MLHTLADNTKMYFTVNGNLQAKSTLVFLNGISQTTESWLLLAPAFYQETRVIMLDLVFQGQSDAAAKFRTFDEHAADVHHFLSSQITGDIILCGISYGSVVAQHALVNYPDFFKSAVLLSTFAHTTARFDYIGESWKNALLARGYPLMFEVMLPIVLGRNYFEQPIISLETLTKSRLNSGFNTENLLQLMLAVEQRGDYREKLKNIKVPVTVVHGEDDLLISVETAKQVAANITRANFVLLPGVGHTLNLEAIAELTAIIRPFIQ